MSKRDQIANRLIVLETVFVNDGRTIGQHIDGVIADVLTQGGDVKSFGLRLLRGCTIHLQPSNDLLALVHSR